MRERCAAAGRRSCVTPSYKTYRKQEGRSCPQSRARIEWRRVTQGYAGVFEGQRGLAHKFFRTIQKICRPDDTSAACMCIGQHDKQAAVRSDGWRPCPRSVDRLANAPRLPVCCKAERARLSRSSARARPRRRSAIARSTGRERRRRIVNRRPTSRCRRTPMHHDIFLPAHQPDRPTLFNTNIRVHRHARTPMDTRPEQRCR